jgi:hypothetical protein
MVDVVGRRTTKKEAALRQIHGAIKSLHDKEYECAITLAGAAEGQLVAAKPDYMFEGLKDKRPEGYKSGKEWAAWLNETRDWLKHPTPKLASERLITEYETWVMIARAVTKFHWTYGKSTKKIEDFVKWCIERGYLTKEWGT